MRTLAIFLFLAVTIPFVTADTASDVGKFLHITDLHVDLQYETGSPATCFLGSTGLRCCREYDVPIKPYRKAGKWGDYNCDTPIDLVEATMSWLNRTHPDIDFVIWTGDTPGHHDFDQSISKNLKDIGVVTALFKEYLPNAQVYPCIGNHDTWPIDQLGAPPLDDFLTDFLVDQWGDWLAHHSDNTTIETLKYGGYYTLKMGRGYRMVAINSLYYDSHNVILGKPTNLTANQWEWFNSTLKIARDSNEKVWIIGHIFPGAGEASGWFDVEYNELVNEYSDIIVAQFWGHSHRDQFFFNRNEQSITNMGYVTPSLMPDTQQSSVRIFNYDKTSMQILDYTDYVVNITELNQTPNLPISKVDYDYYYSAINSYGMADLELGSWIKLAHQMQSNSTLFNLYYSHFYPDRSHGICSGSCKKSQLCAIQYVVPDQYDACIKQS
jgi:sphingomyelin phosphodiesterase